VSRSVINALSAKTGELIGSFTQHSSLISTIALASKSGTEVTIVSGSIDGTIFVWNLESMEVIANATLNCPLFDIQVPQLAQVGKFLAGKNAASDTNRLDIVEQRLREELYVVTGTLAPDAPTGVNAVRAIMYDTEAKKVRLLQFSVAILFLVIYFGLQLRKRVSPVTNPRNGMALLALRHEDKNRIEEILVVAEEK
jgi:hypothetical protein